MIKDVLNKEFEKILNLNLKIIYFYISKRLEIKFDNIFKY